MDTKLDIEKAEYEQTKTLALDLRELLRHQLTTSLEIDEKAWDVLRFTTASFGGAIAIVTQSQIKANLVEAVVLLTIAFALYVQQLWFMRIIILKTNYRVPPAIPRKNFTYSQFDDLYVKASPLRYYDQMIVDYVGPYVDEDSTPDGAIQSALLLNETKLNNVNLMIRNLMVIIVLLALALIASAFRVNLGIEEYIGNWLERRF